jgi:TetR/AcrR family transcriptional regulator
MATAVTRKEVEKAQRRELLLAAAELVFGRKPFDEATMQEVASEAQIGMQGLYEHFSSKQDLYESLIRIRVQRIQARLAEALKPTSDPLQRLRMMARIQTEAFAEAPTFFTVFVRERLHYDWGLSSRFGPVLHKVYREEQRRVRDILAECIQAGKVKSLDLDFLVKACVNAWEASLHYHFRHRPEEEIEACVDRTMEAFLSGLGAGS